MKGAYLNNISFKDLILKYLIEEISKEDVSSIFLYKIPFLVQNTNNINVILWKYWNEDSIL